MPSMMTHSTDGYRTVWHPAEPCDLCYGEMPVALVAGDEYVKPVEINQTALKPALDFAASLFDAPPPPGKYTREELEAQARAKRMAGPPRIFPVGTEACPDCGASFRPAPSRPSFGVVIMHKCGETTPPPISSAAPLPRTYGDVYYSYVVKACPRCDATPDFAGARRGRWSWAHPCKP